jgi:hypothetical protein
LSGAGSIAFLLFENTFVLRIGSGREGRES